MTPGIHLNLSRDEYKAIPALNRSTIVKWIELGDIPSKFKFWLDTKDSQPTSEALLIGNVLDCLLLESPLFGDRFIIRPDDAPKRPTSRQVNTKKPSQDTTDSINWWHQFECMASGKIVLTPDQWGAVHAMEAALYLNESTSDIFKHCRKAVAVGNLWNIDVKAEYDLWNPQSEHLMDLKTCRDVSPKSFARDFINFGYHYQATFYLRLANELGHDKRTFDFVCVESAAPWTVKVYSFTPWEDEQHSRIYDQCLIDLRAGAKELSRRLESGDFIDSPDWERIKVPRWAIRWDLEEAA